MFGVPYIMSAFCSPLLGLLIDRFGKRAFITCISSLILVSGMIMSRPINSSKSVKAAYTMNLTALKVSLNPYSQMSAI